jgi:antitoxin component YwqK of YwqJK toxin-antitoxin module
LKNGHSEFWYEDGTNKSNRFFTNGIQDSIDISWYQNGQPQCQIIYDKGVMIQVTKWFENGNKAEDAHVLDSIPNGKVTSWHSNGTKKFEAIFNMGKIDSSTWKRWDTIGNLLKNSGSL